MCGADAEWKCDMFFLSEVNRASSNHAYLCAVENRKNTIGRCKKKIGKKRKSEINQIVVCGRAQEGLCGHAR